MPTVTRTLLTVHLPINLRVFSATMRAVIDGYTDFVTLESSDGDVDVVRLVIVEDVDDVELRRRGAGLDFGGTFGPGE